MGNCPKCCAEVRYSGVWVCALILVDLVLDGITNVEGEAASDLEGDVDGLAEKENGDVIEAGLVVVTKGRGKGD